MRLPHVVRKTQWLSTRYFWSFAHITNAYDRRDKLAGEAGEAATLGLVCLDSALRFLPFLWRDLRLGLFDRDTRKATVHCLSLTLSYVMEGASLERDFTGTHRWSTHFNASIKMVPIGSGAERPLDDYPYCRRCQVLGKYPRSDPKTRFLDAGIDGFRTIKALPATPHLPRPYGQGISPGRTES